MSPNDPTLRRLTTHLKATLDRGVGDFEPDSGVFGTMAFKEALQGASKITLAFKMNSTVQYEAAKKVIGEIK